MPALRVSENSIHSIGDEAQGRAVDAVAHAVGRLRIAGEHMTEMGVSGAASDLRAAHSVAQILFFHHSGALDRLCKGGPAAAALLRDAVLLRRQLVPDGLRRGLLIVTRVDAQPGKELHLRARDVAVAVRILFEVVLVVFLGGIEVLSGPISTKNFSLRPRSISAMRFTVSLALSLVK